ncbi:MAG: protease modulator HflC [Tissierellales bacterium]|nr:protease modulator HflC [Tissierellales bacterium]MBN2828228.1 protease modulator HflC [Tissierellales bacterium]
MKKGLLIILLILAVVFVSNSAYTVDTREHAIITRFGEVQKVVVNPANYELVEATIEGNPRYSDVKVNTRAGLHFKVPFIENIEKFENRLITYKTAPRQVTTFDKKILILSNNAQWKIVDPLLFRVTMKNLNQASLRLDDILYSEINVQVGKTDAHTLIADKVYIENMSQIVVDDVNVEMSKYGIEVVDNRILKTDLHESNILNIYARMEAERKQKAQQYRSEGEEEKLKIISGADRDAAIMISEARKEAETLKGQGDAEAAKIYSDAYSADPEFYEFYQTLEMYKLTLDGTTLVINEDSPLFKYLMQ